MATPPRDVVERFLGELMNGSRPESAPDLLRNEPLLQRVSAFRAAFADLQVRVVQLVEDDRLVAVHLLATGTHTGPFQGGQATGRTWSSTCTAIYEVRDGRIVDFWINWDTLDILEQLHLVRRVDGASA